MPSLKTDYHLAGTPIYLSIIVGEGQLGTSAVWLGDTLVTNGEPVTGLELGRNTPLAGKELFVKTVVTDVEDKTNHTTVTYLLKGGAHDAEYALDATVNENGDSVIYRASFNLV